MNKECIKKILQNIIKKYEYNCFFDERGNCYLQKYNYYIGFLISYEDIDIIYVCKENNKYYKYFITTFIKKRFTDEDRVLFGQPQDNDERLLKRLIVIEHGLNTKWRCLLEGDKAWIEAFKVDPFGGEPMVMNSDELLS